MAEQDDDLKNFNGLTETPYRHRTSGRSQHPLVGKVDAPIR